MKDKALPIIIHKEIWANIIRSLATLFIIILHVVAPLTYLYGDKNWIFGIIISSIVRSCVPLFVMLSGALLLKKEYPISIFFKKRFTRVILPFLFWIVPYLLLDYSKISNLKTLNSETTITWILNYIFLENSHLSSAYHLWYIYMIISLYLFVPIISKWLKKANNKEIEYFLLLWLVSLFIEPIVLKYNLYFNLHYFSGYLGYFVLGYYLYDRINFKESNTNYCYLVFTLGLAITIITTIYSSIFDNKFNENFFAYLTPNVALMALGLFRLIQQKTIIKTSITKKLIDFISKYSYGIFLSHVLFLYLLNKIGINCNFLNPICGIPLTTLLCLFLSSTSIYILSKIPFLKKFTG